MILWRIEPSGYPKAAAKILNHAPNPVARSPEAQDTPTPNNLLMIDSIVTTL
jgi:hypothetical protein